MKDYLGYEALTQAAMRGVVREALRAAETEGALPGDHHFYITFRTKAPGVKIADHLVERFPQDMTIVIQHQFWDLEVTDRHFEIILKFSGIPQHLSIPFAAIQRFVDPSVDFGLSFENENRAANADVIAPAATAPAVPDAPPAQASDNDTVVSLDQFRRK
ncbi:MAG: ClpXP protease specificity-enhancing factor SspB [Pseudomonadota bacterium]